MFCAWYNTCDPSACAGVAVRVQSSTAETELSSARSRRRRLSLCKTAEWDTAALSD